ncbi:hypothetical protein C8F01DRAFT_1101444 [Mycena amicta]|nr:hypothetical protein C8F01DRAFT_1101444 [Mycena amicta]
MSLLGALRFLFVAAVDHPALELVGGGSCFRGGAVLRTLVLFPAAGLPSSSSATASAFPFPLPESLPSSSSRVFSSLAAPALLPLHLDLSARAIPPPARRE